MRTSSGLSTTALDRSEEHTSELQSQSNLVCRLLLEKKKKYTINSPHQSNRRLLSRRTSHAIPQHTQVDYMSHSGLLTARDDPRLRYVHSVACQVAM